MNLIFTRSRQEQINISWEPFATSTPLKISSNKQKTVNGLPKHLLTQTEPVNLVEKFLKGLVTSNTAPGQPAEVKHSVTKRSKRNRLSAYFDVSSSSDDDDRSENKRPVIKLNSRKKTKSFLTDKLGIEEPGALNGINQDEPVGKCKKKRNFIKNNEKNVDSSVVGVKLKNIQALVGDYKSKSVNQGSLPESDCASSDRENQILELTEKDLIKNAKPILINNENLLNDSNNKEQRNFNKTSKTNIINKDSKILKKSVYKKNNNNNVKRIERATNKTNKTTKLIKKSSKGDIESVRKSPTGKVNPKLSLQVNQEKAITPLRIWDNKTNLSHQLFSDSREQEFINTLDLTSEEFNEGLKSIKSSLIQKQKTLVHSLTTALHPSITNQADAQETKEEKQKQERPKRTKQKPKEFWIPESSLETPFNNADGNIRERIKRNPKISSKNEELVFKTESDSKSEIQDKCFEDFMGLKPKKKVTRKKTKIVKKEKVTANDDAPSKITKKVQKVELNCVSNCSSQRKEFDSNTEPNTKSEKVVVVEEEKKMAVTADKKVFSLLNDLTFKDNALGCSAAECWNKNNFKCGVFKLKENSQLSCKTLYKNSHLNGIVVKGSLKMKVGEEELQLNEGDMTFVPPVTKWQATNIGKCESVFYYWCGRFDS